MKKVIKLTERDLSRIVKRVVKENENEGKREIGRILDDIISSFEFSEKGNDEMITLANYIAENPEEVAIMIMGRLKKGYGAHDEDESGFGVYTRDRGRLNDLESRLGSRR